MNRRFVLLLPLWLGILTLDAHAQNLKAITGATLVDVAGGKSIPNAVVVIDGTRIVQAGPADQTPVPQGATRIDAAGKFVIPGLADMHNHLQTGAFGAAENLKTNLARLLAVGVTTVLDPSLSKADFAVLKSAAEQDSSPYPHFFGTGPIITVSADQLGGRVGSP